jgi:hypothetical protein
MAEPCQQPGGWPFRKEQEIYSNGIATHWLGRQAQEGIKLYMNCVYSTFVRSISCSGQSKLLLQLVDVVENCEFRELGNEPYHARA